MKILGELLGRSVYYNDKGYNQGVWFYSDSVELASDRQREQRACLVEESDELFDTYQDRVKSAWRSAYIAHPTERVPFDLIRDIVFTPVVRKKQVHWTKL